MAASSLHAYIQLVYIDVVANYFTSYSHEKDKSCGSLPSYWFSMKLLFIHKKKKKKIRAVELIPKRAGEECIQQILKKNADAHKLIKYCNL